MRWTVWIALVVLGCGDKGGDSGGVTCEEGSIPIDGECVEGGSGTEEASGGDDDSTTSGSGGTTGTGGVSTDATL